MNKNLYSIIVAVYNEEEVLPEFYRRITGVCNSLDGDYELLFVNDGSRDRSFEILKKFREQNPRVKIIELSRNFGQQAAMTAGLGNASGDAVINIDADLQDPPETILKMIEKWHEGYEVVYGQRNARKGESKIRNFVVYLFNKFLKVITKYPIPENVGDFFLMDRKVVNAFLRITEQHRFMRGLVSWIGFRQSKVSFVRDPRYAGKTKNPFRTMIRVALDGITSFSVIPLRMIIILGFAIVIIALIFAVYTLIQHFKFPTETRGWASLMLAILFFGGVQLIMIGVVGEYIGRIYEEVKKRPLYIIKTKEGFKGK